MSNPVIIKQIKIRNFKLFRRTETFDFSKGTYLVGANNSGKTTVLSAIRYFFDDTLYETRDFLNRTEVVSRQGRARISDIWLTFNLSLISKARLRDSLVKQFGKTIEIRKSVKQTEAGVLEYSYEYKIKNGSREVSVEDLPPDLKELLQSIKVNYLHPQRGQELLEDAQVKLRKRLLDNWGRARNVTQSVRDLEAQWATFRVTATTYLSESLQSNIQRVWPEGEVSISLPRDIKEILAISDISFSGIKGAPSVNLLGQGSGAQTLILYFTHFMLDADRTSRRAMAYHPIWLLEEPESFMHADMISKLADEINSTAWTENIPLVISTHSSILLSRSRVLGEEAIWHRLKQGEKTISKSSSKWTSKEIDQIGTLMGDSNFKFYFEASKSGTSIYSEDEKEETIKSLQRSGINVSSSVQGVTKFKQMITSLAALDKSILKSKMIVLIDNDQGFTEIKHLVDEDAIATSYSFSLLRIIVLDNAFVLLLPTDCAVEDLYEEMDSQIDIVANLLVNNDLTLRSNPPSNFSDLVTKLRRNPPTDRPSLLGKVKKSHEFKSYFWKKVESNAWKVADVHIGSMTKLIEIARQDEA